MKNLKDPRTKIYPSTTRGGKELPSSSALDSPSVMSKFATPTLVIDSDMSHVIDDATSAMHDSYDETTSMLDNTMPLGEFLDEQLARVRENEIIETDNTEDSDDEDSLNMNYLLFLRVMFWRKKLLELEKLKILDLMILMKVMMKNHLLFLWVMSLIKKLL